MTQTYEGSHQQYGVIVDTNVMVPARDGVELATDIFYPAEGDRKAAGRFPAILEWTPYDKAAARQVAKGKFFARRGYVFAVQDVRGRFKSEGEWYAFANEAPDGYDALEWIARQPWSDGQVGTMGDSYAGSDQSALATLNPPHLSTMVVAVGASNYHHSSMRHNGTLEQRFMVYAFRMAVTSKEASADPGLKAALLRIFPEEIPQILDQLPLKEGATVLRRLPSYERWAVDILTHGDYDDYWKQRGYSPSEYYSEHADVPTLYLGGWYDSYARNTCESYVALSKMKTAPQRLLMGPWTHGQYEVTFSGDVDFGTGAHIDYNDLKLAWFDHYMKGMHTEVADWAPASPTTTGVSTGAATGETSRTGPRRKPVSRRTTWWEVARLLPECRPAGTGPSTSFTFDPRNPVPTMGGGISEADTVLRPGAFDQRGRPDFLGCTNTLPLNSRADVLTFQTLPLVEDADVTGPVEMHLWASSSAVDTDFTAKLIDVYPPSSDYPEGLAINITDSIVRARYRNGYEKPELMTPGEPYEFEFELYPTSTVFRSGHRIRVDVSSSNWPRFDVNPNTGGPLGRDQSYQLAHQTVYHDADCPSHIVLPIQER